MPMKRKIEVFSAGCPCCFETIELVRKSACPSCEVTVLDMRSHLGTGQLCPGNADMFKLSGPKKQAYLEALNSYNKAVAAASKQFLADAKTKAGLSEAELALAQSWFAEGLNPEINKILAAKEKK